MDGDSAGSSIAVREIVARSIAAMLPDGFQWRTHVGDEPALFLEGHHVAYLSQTGTNWRIGINPTLITRRYVFRPTEATARAYVEAWAHTWQHRLRDEYRG